jgi:hypothetical protein
MELARGPPSVTRIDGDLPMVRDATPPDFRLAHSSWANFIDAAPFQRIIRVGEADDLPGSAIA